MRLWSLTILTLLPLVSRGAGHPALSLHAPGNLRRSIDQYLADYRTWTKTAPTGATSVTAAAPLKLPSFSDELNSLLESQNYGDRPADALSDEIVRRRNGGTLAERLAAKIGWLSDNLTEAPGETYNEIVAALLADYYLNPQDRDALVPLLRTIGDRLPTNPTYDTSDPILDPMRQGTMIAYVFIVVWDWRGGLKGLSQDLRGLGTAVQRPIAFGSKRLADLFRNPLRGKGEAEPTEQAQTLAMRVREFHRNLNNPLKSREARQDGLKRLVASLKTHANQLGRSFVIGGIPAGLLGANQVTEPARIHPTDALDVIQAFAIADLEMQVIHLRDEAQALLKNYLDPKTQEPLLTKARADGDKLRRFVAESQLQDLYAAFAHFQREAKKFQGQNEWPDLAERLRRYRKPDLYYRRSSRDRVADLVEASKELTGLLQASADRVNEAKAKAGLTLQDTLYVNLLPIQANLAATETLVQAIQVLAGPAPKTVAMPVKP